VSLGKFVESLDLQARPYDRGSTVPVLVLVLVPVLVVLVLVILVMVLVLALARLREKCLIGTCFLDSRT
jgi:hypothetical protein